VLEATPDLAFGGLDLIQDGLDVLEKQGSDVGEFGAFWPAANQSRSYVVFEGGEMVADGRLPIVK